MHFFFSFLFLRFYLFTFRERGRGRERETNSKVWLPLTFPLLGAWPNPGVCPDWESNQWPFGLQAGTQSTKPHQPGLKGNFLNETISLLHSFRPKALPDGFQSQFQFPALSLASWRDTIHFLWHVSVRGCMKCWYHWNVRESCDFLEGVRVASFVFIYKASIRGCNFPHTNACMRC